MFVIPVGSDASQRHVPVVTLVLVGLCILATLAVWKAHPAAIVEGIPALIEAVADERAEAVWAAEERAWEAVEAEVAALGHPTFRSLERELGVATPSQDPLTIDELAWANSRLAEAAKAQWIASYQQTDLERRLALRPVWSAMESQAARFGIEGVHRPPLGNEDKGLAKEAFQEAFGMQRITAEEFNELLKRLAACRDAGDGYADLRERITEDARRPLSTAEVESLRIAIDDAKNQGNLNPVDLEELNALLAARTVVAADVAERSVATAADVPWYLAPAGAWSNPLRWVMAMAVHPRWSDALIGIGLTWSFGVVAEGLLGWRRFLVLVGAGVALSCVWTQITGVFAPTILVQAGSTEFRSFLAGVLVMWVPANVIHYVRWFIVPLGDFEMAIWKVFVFGVVSGLVIGFFNGMPLVIGVLGQLVCPLAGLAVGYVTLRLGWIPTGGWDLPLLWETRKLSATDRAAFLRDRHGVLPQAVVQGVIPAHDLTAEAEAEIIASLQEGAVPVALGLWKATRAGHPSWRVPAPLLNRLLRACYQAGLADETRRVAEALVELYPQQSRDARLILAQQAIEDRKPATARSQLDSIAPEQRTPAAEPQIRALRARIAALEAEGVHEVEFS